MTIFVSAYESGPPPGICKVSVDSSGFLLEFGAIDVVDLGAFQTLN